MLCCRLVGVILPLLLGVLSLVYRRVFVHKMCSAYQRRSEVELFYTFRALIKMQIYRLVSADVHVQHWLPITVAPLTLNRLLHCSTKFGCGCDLINKRQLELVEDIGLFNIMVEVSSNSA